MMKEEFEALIDGGDVHKIPQAQYEIIEAVYNWHPAIADKQAIATLYNIGGMGIIETLLPLARKMERMDNEMRQLRIRLNELKDERDEISGTYRPKWITAMVEEDED